jgi:hypothetical protein
MKKQEIRTLVAKKLLAEDIFTTYEFPKLEPSGMSELEFQLAMGKLKVKREIAKREKKNENVKREKENVKRMKKNVKKKKENEN